MDIDNLDPGEDFAEAIAKSVGSCDILIAVIGRHWLDASDPDGNRRLDNPDDFVRLEISTALKRSIRVMPVLVDGAVMPRPTQLPDDLQPIVRRQAVEVSHNHFATDSERIISAINRAFEKALAEEQELARNRLESELGGKSTSLSWDNVLARKAWSTQLIASVTDRIAQLEEANPNAFIDGYNTLSSALRIKFWAEILIAIAKFESNWNPHDIFHEPPPRNVDSIGLLQLSYQDQAEYKLEPLSEVARSLEDPLVNLRCGVTIFATLAGQDRTVASSVSGKFRGAARYWSTLRAGHKLDQIVALTKNNVGL